MPAASEAAVADTFTVAGVALPEAGATVSHVTGALAVQVTDEGDEERLNACDAVGPLPATAVNERLVGVTVNVGADETVNVTGICDTGPVDGVRVMVVL